MPKLKTKKGVVKRLRLNKAGKVKYSTCGKSHLSSSKTSKRLRHLRKAKTIEDRKNLRYIKRMLPYG